VDEETIRRIVRDELWNEVNREGGVCDHTRTASFNMLKEMFDVLGRNLRAEMFETNNASRH
jgi:hypothetical protein